MADNRHGEERRPAAGAPRGARSDVPRGGQRRGEGRPAPNRSGPDRARRAQPHTDGERTAPGIPADVDAKQLAPDVRRELITLDKSTADTIARHLVAAGELLDDDPEAALAHAQAARARSGQHRRDPGGRRASPPTTAATGPRRSPNCAPPAGWAASLRCCALIADCERGVGRPERAIELARSPEAAELTGDDADELRIVAAGARADLGQLEQALAVLSSPQPDPARTGQTAARLFYAYAETLLALGRSDEALQWFLQARQPQTSKASPTPRTGSASWPDVTALTDNLCAAI